MQDFAPKHANTPPGSDFPTAEDLAAYIDGTLSKAERARVTEHLASCEDCYAIYMETLHFQLESSPAEPDGVVDAEVKRFAPAAAARAARSSGAGPSRTPLWLPFAALLLLSVGSVVYLAYQFLATPKLTSSPAAPPLASLPPTEPGKSPLWLGPTTRGEGSEEEVKIDEASFRMGVQLVNLDATLQAGQAQESQDVIARIINLLKTQPFMDDLDKSYRGITIALEKKPPAEFLPEAAKLARESREALADPTSFDLGQIVEAGRLAAMARNPTFFQQPEVRKFLRRLLWNDRLDLHDVKLDPTTRESLTQVFQIVGRRDLRASDYAELRQVLERVLEAHYPQS